MNEQLTLFIAAAKMAKERDLAIAVKQGKCAIQRITYAPSGVSTVQDLHCDLTAYQAMQILGRMPK